MPVLLAYVYGVVPISLCRSGGCGVSTAGGVRFQFDEGDNVTVTSHGKRRKRQCLASEDTLKSPVTQTDGLPARGIRGAVALTVGSVPRRIVTSI